MPPSTLGRDGFSAAIASAAAIVISAKRRQSGSTSGSQWDLLFGSFQIIAASIIRALPLLDRLRRRPPHVNLLLRAREDFKAGASQHSFDASSIRRPPIARIAGIAMLDEMKAREIRAVEGRPVPECVILGDRGGAFGAALHRLKHHQIADDMFAD